MVNLSIIMSLLVGLLASFAMAEQESEVFTFFGILTPHCAQEFLVNFNFFDVPCLKKTISTGLSIGMVVGGSIVKLPQVFKIMKAESVEGLSPSMFILEMFGYLISSLYCALQGFPFITYGEVALIGVQSVIIFFLFHKYSGISSANFSLIFMLLVTITAVMGGGYLSSDIVTVLQAATIPIFAISKIPQIISNLMNSSTGQLSFITCFLNFAGNSARIFTTIQDVDDPVVLAGHVTTAILNGILFAQVIYYWNSAINAKKTN